MVDALATHPGIGLLMVRSGTRGTIAVGRAGIHYLAGRRGEGRGPGRAVRRDTRPTACGGSTAWSTAGDIVVISLLDPETDEVAAFEELIGSHGGLGGPQTKPFILHPSEWTVDEPIVGAEAVYARSGRGWRRSIS